MTEKTKKRKNNAVRVPFYEELQRLSELSHYSMSTLLILAWQKFKNSEDYSKIMLGLY